MMWKRGGGGISTWTRRALGISGGLFAGVLAWTLLHEVPGVLPAMADGARWLVGDEAVTTLEDGVYSVTDQVKRRVYRDRAPRARWTVQAQRQPPPRARLAGVVPAAAVPKEPPFRPRDVGPMYLDRAAEGDGAWMAAEPAADADEPVSYKTLIHPDPERSYAELFVVALDLRHVKLHAVAGSSEPENSAPGAREHVRAAAIPERHRASLLAAFNGGFKSTHGHFGMRVDGITLAAPKPHSCTIAMYEDGKLVIGTFSELSNADQMVWFRQTPRCMVEAGVRHPRLENSKSWGATLNGETVIRRSAIGLDRSGEVLYVGISNSTTADALARGMQHAGAHTVAQLDVNYSFPRFLFYEHDTNGLETVPLAEGFVYTKGQYVNSRSDRDFFYLTRSDASSRVAAGNSTNP